jgi:hypothetical protein
MGIDYFFDFSQSFRNVLREFSLHELHALYYSAGLPLGLGHWALAHRMAGHVAVTDHAKRPLSPGTLGSQRRPIGMARQPFRCCANDRAGRTVDRR